MRTYVLNRDWAPFSKGEMSDGLQDIGKDQSC